MGIRDKILLINPPVYDFASFDFWLKPLGLMYISSLLKNGGKEIAYFDVMDRFHPLAPFSKSDKWGRGKFFSDVVEKPEPLKDIPRKYKRYGIPKLYLEKIIAETHWDYILLTTTMTYWYYGAMEVLNFIRKYRKSANVIIGGVYASLLPEHAKALGFDEVITYKNLNRVSEIFGISIPPSFQDFPLPDYEPYKNHPYAPILTGLGCPFRCTYCATHYLHPEIQQKSVETVISEILGIAKMGFKNIVFYDDALLFPQDRAKEIFEGIIKRNLSVNFHTPNGLGVRFIDLEMAKLLKQAGFRNLYLSLENINEKFQYETGGKLTTEEFLSAVKNLYRAGFEPKNLNAYILCGIPGLDKKDVLETIKFAHSLGIRVMLSEYSPIPHTPLFKQLNLDGIDPLWHNNTIFPYYSGNIEEIQRLKDFAKALNRER